MKINKIIVKDANLFSSINKFTKEFVEMIIILLIDFFFEYDQVRLIKKNRDIIVMQISIKLLRTTRLFQKIINFVTEFVKIVIKIFVVYIIIKYKSFLNDINVKSLRNTYDNLEIILEIKFFVLKYI